jgi:hypothetical protein
MHVVAEPSREWSLRLALSTCALLALLLSLVHSWDPLQSDGELSAESEPRGRAKMVHGALLAGTNALDTLIATLGRAFLPLSFIIIAIEGWLPTALLPPVSPLSLLALVSVFLRSRGSSHVIQTASLVTLTRWAQLLVSQAACMHACTHGAHLQQSKASQIAPLRLPMQAAGPTTSWGTFLQQLAVPTGLQLSVLTLLWAFFPTSSSPITPPWTLALHGLSGLSLVAWAADTAMRQQQLLHAERASSPRRRGSPQAEAAPGRLLVAVNRLVVAAVMTLEVFSSSASVVDLPSMVSTAVLAVAQGAMAMSLLLNALLALLGGELCSGI